MQVTKIFVVLQPAHFSHTNHFDAIYVFVNKILPCQIRYAQNVTKSGMPHFLGQFQHS